MKVDVHKMVEDKLPIKYILGIQEKLEAFPDAFDILYIFINEAVKRPDRQKETFTRHALMKYFSKGNLDNASEGLKKAIQLGLIKQTKFEEGKETYEIKINPYI
tara:strand:+ start:145 stop:456 length:312 start_codon:yes stop_codon:yes gene_type:complete